MIFNFDTTTWHNYFLENKIDVKVDFDSILLSYIIYQGTDILPKIFSSSPDRRVFAARKLHEGFSPRVILSDKHECWTARKNFRRYTGCPRTRGSNLQGVFLGDN
jgi:hypothetical protein